MEFLDNEDMKNIQKIMHEYIKDVEDNEILEKLIVKLDDYPCFNNYQWQLIFRVLINYWEDLKEYSQKTQKFELSSYEIEEMEALINTISRRVDWY